VARVCARPETDVLFAYCPDDPGAVCAEEGTVTLSYLPDKDAGLAGLNLALDVTFANGYRREGSFEVESSR